MRTDVRRVLFAGDWHGDLSWAATCVGLADMSNVDAIVQLGDFGVWPGRSGKVFLDGLNTALADARLTCYFIDGNHEDFPQLREYPIGSDGTRVVRPYIRHLPRGFRWWWSGMSFLALGGATSLDRAERVEWVNWWRDEEITVADVYASLSGGHTDVMLTHDCPAGVDIPGLSTHWPRAALRRANQHRAVLADVVKAVNPERLVHGHFHVGYNSTFRNTQVIGLASNGMEANTMVVDLHEWRVGHE